MSRVTTQQKALAEAIATIVAKELGVLPQDFFGPHRTTNKVIDARFIAIILIKEIVTSACDADIARAVKRERSAVYKARKSAANYLKTSDAFSEKYHNAKTAIEKWIIEQSK